MSQNPMPLWYLQWVKHHAAAFALNNEASQTMLKWGPVFVKLFTARELHEATDELIGKPMGLDWVREHRTALIEAVAAQRSRAKAKEKQDRYSVCAFCLETGFCMVPHPGFAHGWGKWHPVLRMPAEDPLGLTRTVAVACCCEVGQRTVAGEQERGREILTLTTYEHRYPNYREVAAERESVLRAAAQEPTATDYENLNRILSGIRILGA